VGVFFGGGLAGSCPAAYGRTARSVSVV